MQIVNVSCAIIVNNNKVLAVQRNEKMSLPLKWEFPGGKIEEGESAEDCIIREIKEELMLDINLIIRLHSFTHAYPKQTVCLIPFIASCQSNTIRLQEHRQFVWLDSKDLLSLDWAEADIPIVNEYLNRWS